MHRFEMETLSGAEESILPPRYKVPGRDAEELEIGAR